jgi:hypothetical protein
MNKGNCPINFKKADIILSFECSLRVDISSSINKAAHLFASTFIKCFGKREN